jgi:hypothetical protein
MPYEGLSILFHHQPRLLGAAKNQDDANQEVEAKETGQHLRMDDGKKAKSLLEQIFEYVSRHLGIGLAA